MKLNEIKLIDIYSENQLKQFHPRQQLRITTDDEDNFSNQKTIANNEKKTQGENGLVFLLFKSVFRESLLASE